MIEIWRYVVAVLIGAGLLYVVIMEAWEWLVTYGELVAPSLVVALLVAFALVQATSARPARRRSLSQ